MQRTATQRSYGARIKKVVAHLGERLDQPLTLETLAAVGHFSPYHFHRIYRGLMGETVADTLRRMRLHRAAVELAWLCGRPAPARSSAVPIAPSFATASPIGEPCGRSEWSMTRRRRESHQAEAATRFDSRAPMTSSHKQVPISPSVAGKITKRAIAVSG